jgi:hypothetical protein
MLHASTCAAEAGDLTLMSAQGAERPVRLPGELTRFQGLPMRVVFAEGPEDGAPVGDKARTAPVHVTRLGEQLAE